LYFGFEKEQPTEDMEHPGEDQPKEEAKEQPKEGKAQFKLWKPKRNYTTRTEMIKDAVLVALENLKLENGGTLDWSI